MSEPTLYAVVDTISGKRMIGTISEVRKEGDEIVVTFTEHRD